MRTIRPNPPLSVPLSWASLSPSRRRRLLALLGAMMLAALHASPHVAEVDDERQHR